MTEHPAARVEAASFGLQASDQMVVMLRTMLALGIVGLLLSGCLPTGSIGTMGSNRACMDDNAKFSDAWACVKARLTARQTSGSDAKRDGFLEEGELLAGQVRAGKISDAEARRRLSAGLSREIGQ